MNEVILEFNTEEVIQGLSSDPMISGHVEKYLLSKGWLNHITPICDRISRRVAETFVLNYDAVPFAPDEVGEVDDIINEWWKLDPLSIATWEQACYLYYLEVGFDVLHGQSPRGMASHSAIKAQTIMMEYVFGEPVSYLINIKFSPSEYGRLVTAVCDFVIEAHGLDIEPLLNNLKGQLYTIP